MIDKINVKLKKQPVKYISKVDSKISSLLIKSLEDLSEWKGNITKIIGTDYYRLKIPKYRFIFTYDIDSNIIMIEEINTRTNINYREWVKK